MFRRKILMLTVNNMQSYRKANIRDIKVGDTVYGCYPTYSLDVSGTVRTVNIDFRAVDIDISNGSVDWSCKVRDNGDIAAADGYDDGVHDLWVYDNPFVEEQKTFKVGDTVVAKENTEYVITNKGWLGVVTQVYDDGLMHVREEGESSGGYNVRQEYFDLYKPPRWQYKGFTGGSGIVAVPTEDSKPLYSPPSVLPKKKSRYLLD